jgi:hypothetical protein
MEAGPSLVNVISCRQYRKPGTLEIGRHYLRKETTMYLTFETILILLLLAFIVGLVAGVSLARPHPF